MSTAPNLLLADLRAQGLRLTLRDGQIGVTPRERLTPELRARIVDRKPDLLAALDAERRATADLERRVRAMADRWQYSQVDLTEALQAARDNPAAWLWTVTDDEAKAEDWRRRGWLPS